MLHKNWGHQGSRGGGDYIIHTQQYHAGTQAGTRRKNSPEVQIVGQNDIPTVLSPPQNFNIRSFWISDARPVHRLNAKIAQQRASIGRKIHINEYLHDACLASAMSNSSLRHAAYANAALTSDSSR